MCKRAVRFSMWLIILFLCTANGASAALGDDINWREGQEYPANAAGMPESYLRVVWNQASATFYLRLSISSSKLQEALPDGIGISVVFYDASATGREVCILSGETKQFDAAVFDVQSRAEHYKENGLYRLTAAIALKEPKDWGETATCDAVVLTPEGGGRVFAQKRLVIEVPTTAKPVTTKPPPAAKTTKPRTTKPKTTKRPTVKKNSAGRPANAAAKKGSTSKSAEQGGVLTVGDESPVESRTVLYFIGLVAVLLLACAAYILFTRAKRNQTEATKPEAKVDEEEDSPKSSKK